MRQRPPSSITHGHGVTETHDSADQILLPHHADLLRELGAAPRDRVHDDRRRRARALPAACAATTSASSPGSTSTARRSRRPPRRTASTPQEWVDAIAPKFLDAWEMLDITNDDFIRTTEPRHERAPRRSSQTLYETRRHLQGPLRGLVLRPRRDLLDRGPARRRQTCPQCGRDVEFIREDNWFFKLSAFQDRLLALYEANPEFIQPETRRNEVAVASSKAVCKDLSISRAHVHVGHPAAVRRRARHVRVVRRAPQLHHGGRLRRPRAGRPSSSSAGPRRSTSSARTSSGSTA